MLVGASLENVCTAHIQYLKDVELNFAEKTGEPKNATSQTKLLLQRKLIVFNRQSFSDREMQAVLQYESRRIPPL